MSEVMIPVKGGGGTSSDDVTASRSNILQGKTTVTSDSDDEIVEGIMPNCGAKTASLNCGGSYPIPAGYHNGSGKVTANSLASQTGVQNGKTAIVPAAVRSGYEGWVNGSRVTGNMANYTGNTNRKTIAPSTGQQTWKIPAGYHDGNGYVTVSVPAAGSAAAIFGSYYCWNSSNSGTINAYPKDNKVNIDANGTDGFKIKYAGKYKVFAHLYSGDSSSRELKLYKNSSLLKSVTSNYGCANIDMDVQCAVNDVLKIQSMGRSISVTVLFLVA